MVRLQGQAVFEGVALGQIAVWQKPGGRVQKENRTDTEAELVRFDEARKQAEAELDFLYRKTLAEAGKDAAGIFRAHKLILSDPDYVGAVQKLAQAEAANVEYAVACVGEQFRRMFLAMDNVYMRERAEDVKDVSGRLVEILSGKHVAPGGEPSGKEASGKERGGIILLAEDLTPSETVQLDRARIRGFVTRYGSANSHTAILARTMNIPALVGVDFPEGLGGREAALDGCHGVLYIEPEGKVRERLLALRQEEQDRREGLLSLRGERTVTADGREIGLYANIAGASDADAALENGAEGIGLFRSEFLYLEAADYPDEETQLAAYLAVVEKMQGRPVIIRTMDIGADKRVDYFGLAAEENPAMGYRAIRICLERPELFRTQLRAILRAGASGPVSVMFPMITSVAEVCEIKKALEEAKAGLAAEGLPFGEVELGIMVETPAAALTSDLLAKEVDFFSIGTNDLTQYTLAVDRQNPRLARFFDPHHEAVLRLIRMVVENGHREGCKVGICGELAADASLTEEFLRMGVDELSVSPAFILPLRERIRGMQLGSGGRR